VLLVNEMYLQLVGIRALPGPEQDDREARAVTREWSFARHWLQRELDLTDIC
jgi:hypothetical protein